MNIEIPERASCLRTLWHELSRLHSHLLWFGLAADAMGFESLFMNAWRIREIVLDILKKPQEAGSFSRSAKSEA